MDWKGDLQNELSHFSQPAICKEKSQKAFWHKITRTVSFPLWCDAEWNWVMVRISQYQWGWGKSAKREGHWKTSHRKLEFLPLEAPCTAGEPCSWSLHSLPLHWPLHPARFWSMVTTWSLSSVSDFLSQVNFPASSHQVIGTCVLCLIAPCPKHMVLKWSFSIWTSSSCHMSWETRDILTVWENKVLPGMLEKRAVGGCVTWEDNQEEEHRNSCLILWQILEPEKISVGQDKRKKSRLDRLDINYLICRKWPQLCQTVFFSVSEVTWEGMDIEVTHSVAPSDQTI